MKEREFEALLRGLEDAVNSSKPASEVVLDVKELIDRAKSFGNVESTFALPDLTVSGSPASPMGTEDKSDLLDALQQAILNVRGNLESSAVSLGAPHIPPVLYPEGQRAAVFGRCFPFYAKYFQFGTQKTSLLKRSAKGTFKTAFTPDATRFVLSAAKGAYYIYKAPTGDLNDGPILQYSGTIPDVTQHCYLTLNNFWLVLGTVTGTINVISLQTGEIIWTNKLNLGISGLEVSRSGSYIGVSFLGTSRDGVCQPMVLLLCPDTCSKDAAAFSHVVEVTFVSPYLDPVRTLAFSPDELHIVCSTSQESRFFVVSLVDIREPRLVSKSSRKVPADNHHDYEGITRALFFPRRAAIVVTSVAPISPPIVLDPKISTFAPISDSHAQSLSSSSSRSQLQILLKAEKVGSSIHNAVVSPHENAIAFLDKTGLVYVVFWPKTIDHSKKVSVVFELTDARSCDLAAALQFSEDGTILYAVDSRGFLHIADFGAAHPQSAGITRLRLLT